MCNDCYSEGFADIVEKAELKYQCKCKDDFDENDIYWEKDYKQYQLRFPCGAFLETEVSDDR